MNIGEASELVEGKRVALVGNASTLLQTDHGERIDAHDHVVRLNQGLPRPGLEPAIGAKFTIWGGQKHPNGHTFEIVHERTDGFPRRRSFAEVQDLALPVGVEMSWVFCYGSAFKDIRISPKIPKAWMAPIPMIQGIHEDLGARPTTGLVMIRLLLDLFPHRPKSLNLFGFDFLKSESWPYGVIRDHNVSPHDPELESEYVRSRFTEQPWGWSWQCP